MASTASLTLNDGTLRQRIIPSKSESLEIRATRLASDLSLALSAYEKVLPAADAAAVNLVKAKQMEEKAVSSEELDDDSVREIIGLHTRARNVASAKNADLLKESKELDEIVLHFHGALYQLQLAEIDRVRENVRRDIAAAGKVFTDTVPARAAIEHLLQFTDPVIETAALAPPEIQNMWPGRPGYWPRGTRASADFARDLLGRYERLMELSGRKSGKS
jgi:hypothetical protein